MNAYIMTLDGQIKLLRAMENVTYGSVEHTKIVLFDDSWSDIPNLEPSWLYKHAECCYFFQENCEMLYAVPKKCILQPKWMYKIIFH